MNNSNYIKKLNRNKVFFTWLLLSFGLLLFNISTFGQGTVIWTEDFEEAGNDTYTANQASIPNLSNSWSYEKDNEGRLRLAAGYNHGGGNAATLDDDTDGGNYSQNYIAAIIDISAYSFFDGFSLSFWYMDHGDESQANDAVWVRTGNDDSQTWVQVYDLQPATVTNGSWNNITVDITSVIESQPASNYVQIRFGQYDNYSTTSSTGLDGITFDDITLSGYNSIWSEDFTYADGTTTGTGSPTNVTVWTADGTINNPPRGIDVRSNQLQSYRTQGASGRNTWN